MPAYHACIMLSRSRLQPLERPLVVREIEIFLGRVRRAAFHLGAKLERVAEGFEVELRVDGEAAAGRQRALDRGDREVLLDLEVARQDGGGGGAARGFPRPAQALNGG